MTVKELADLLGLEIVAGEAGINQPVSGGYCGDLLSDVMANAPSGCAWITVQGHQNIVAVALLREMAAVILSGGHKPEEATLQKADLEGIPILLWPDSAYTLAGRIYASGVGDPPPDRS